MLDNQSRMRSMLNLIEAVDQDKKIKLNESIGFQSEAVEDTHQDPESLAEEALDAAAAYIQDKLGITDGGPAGVFFSGENGLTVEKIFADYVMFEYQNMEHDDQDSEQEDSRLEEAVSRKDFRQVADIIKEIPDEAKRRELANHHCEIFKQQNPRFSREKFMSYIGLDESLNEDGGSTVEVHFINSGLGQDMGAKSVQNMGITLDANGRPVMKVSSPFTKGETLVAQFDPKSGGWIADLD